MKSIKKIVGADFEKIDFPHIHTAQVGGAPDWEVKFPDMLKLPTTNLQEQR